jgi:hypothetical protein
MLLFKKSFYEKIRRGEKTTTLRYWSRRQVRVGAVHTVPRLGKVKIIDVAVVQLDQLEPADVQADGFASLDALREALAEMYTPQQRSTRQLFRVQFAFLQADREN